MKHLSSTWAFYLYTVGTFLLFLYSFTQVDLGLALTRFPQLFTIQRAFQSIGYFNRPLSVWLFIGIVLLLFVIYFVLLSLARRKKLERSRVWKYIFIVTALCAFSYNAFSYDLFNYIFDAKIFTFYQQNPYEHKALDYPGDPMLGFMHWTHRTYPYGPVWLGFTIPLSYAGLQIFLLTFLIFKLFAAACFLGSVYFIEKIAEKTGIKNTLVPIVFFAFNPYILIESVQSAHNDIAMMFLGLGSFYLLIKKRYILSIVLMILSVGTKFATVFLIPAYLSLIVLLYMKVKFAWNMIWYTVIGCMLLAVLAAAQTSGNFQPWYLLLFFPFLSFLSENKFISYMAGFVSAVMLLSYAPFLYLGNWNEPVPSILSTIYITTISVVFIGMVIYLFVQRKKYVKK